MTLFAIVNAGLFPLLHLGRPWFFYWLIPYPATMRVWPQFRSSLPWDVAAVFTYLTVSIYFWYLGLVPDLASARDMAPTRAKRIAYGIFALGLPRLDPRLEPLPGRLRAARRSRRRRW